MKIKEFERYVAGRIEKDPPNLGGIKLLIVNNSEEKRKHEADSLRDYLDYYLGTINTIKKHKSNVYDCNSPTWKSQFLSDADEMVGTRIISLELPFERLKDEMIRGRVLVPIFHNADDVITKIYNGMWSVWYPSIFTVSHKGYQRLRKDNYSKADCFDRIEEGIDF